MIHSNNKNPYNNGNKNFDLNQLFEVLQNIQSLLEKSRKKGMPDLHSHLDKLNTLLQDLQAQGMNIQKLVVLVEDIKEIAHSKDVDSTIHAVRTMMTDVAADLGQ